MATAGDTAPRHVSVTAPASPRGTIALPASKSLSARALILDALTQSPGALHNLAVCDDTHAMLQALLSNQPHIAVGGAGTAMRFLTAYFSAQAGRRVTLDGDQRMRCRPIAPLVEALRQLGAHITYADREGFPPLHIEGRTLRGTHIVMPGDVSSQFISALLMIAPTIGGITLEITGDIVSRPYIDMTLAMMAQRGVNARWTGNAIVVPEGQYTAVDYTVEADWSAASYWLAWQALLPQAQLTLAGLQRDSLQGDQRVLALLENMGMSAHWTSGGLTLVAERFAQCCCSTFADLSGTPVSDTAEIEAAAGLMPRLKKVVMCDCGLPDEEMDALDRRHASVRFVWAVHFSVYTLRTDATVFCASDLPNRGYIAPQASSEELSALRYCRDLVALDLGHMMFRDLGFLERLTHLKYLILVEERFHDISVLGKMQELEYLEIFNNTIDDISPLLNCKALRHLNVGYTRGYDPAPLGEMTWLERLWYPGNRIEKSEREAIVASLSDTKCYFPTWDEDGSTGGGWRTDEAYYEMRNAFGMFYQPGGTGTGKTT